MLFWWTCLTYQVIHISQTYWNAVYFCNYSFLPLKCNLFDITKFCLCYLSVLICILLFVTLYRTAADTDVVEDAKRVTLVDETDDSCTTHPLDRAVNDYCTPDCTGPIIEVKWDNFPDVKIEIANANDMECPDISVKVSMCCSYFYYVTYVHVTKCSCRERLWKCIRGCQILLLPNVMAPKKHAHLSNSYFV